MAIFYPTFCSCCNSRVIGISRYCTVCGDPVNGRDEYEDEEIMEDDIEEDADDDWKSTKEVGDSLIARLKERWERGVTYERIESGDSYFTKLRKIRGYYEVETPDILAHHKTHPTTYYRAYSYDWATVCTPIELDAWQVIRALGHIVLYPQFPVDRFQLDFANPVLRIGVELDGKAYHEEARDRARDRRLKALGWKIYRITGSEMHKICDPFQEEYYSIEEAMKAVKKFIMYSGEGVLFAIRIIHFQQQCFLPNITSESADRQELLSVRHLIYSLCQQTLGTHTYYDTL